MAENESLDLGGAYSKRWTPVFDAVRRGGSSKEVAQELKRALLGGLKKVLKQFEECGVSVSDLLASRTSREALRQLIRKLKGHQYARLFESAAALNFPNDTDCLRGWVNSILDTVNDHICHQVGGSDNWPSFFEVQEFVQAVRATLDPDIEQIVTKLQNDPNSLKRLPKGSKRMDPTTELMSMSLLGSQRS